jgi:hypothetical protein
MQTDETDGKKEEAKYFGSGKTFKGFQGMCETMSGCCSYQNNYRAIAFLLCSH